MSSHNDVARRSSTGTPDRAPGAEHPVEPCAGVGDPVTLDEGYARSLDPTAIETLRDAALAARLERCARRGWPPPRRRP